MANHVSISYIGRDIFFSFDSLISVSCCERLNWRKRNEFPWAPTLVCGRVNSPYARFWPFWPFLPPSCIRTVLCARNFQLKVIKQPPMDTPREPERALDRRPLSLSDKRNAQWIALPLTGVLLWGMLWTDFVSKADFLGVMRFCLTAGTIWPGMTCWCLLIIDCILSTVRTRRSSAVIPGLG